MKKFRRLFILVALCGLATSLWAVSPEEMEQARTIAAQQYLRWANDGSGYLDEIHPTTMAALEKSLKQKEKENIASFKAVKTPTDFASWDKAKLVGYWSETFFQSAGLIEKGKGAKGRVKRKIEAMKVSDATPVVATKEDAKKETPTADTNAPVTLSEGAALAAAADEAVAIESTAEAEAVVEDAPPAEKRSNTSWIYIVALCVLIGVVVWLVIFASKTMRNNEEYPEVEEERRKEDIRKRLPEPAEVETHEEEETVVAPVAERRTINDRYSEPNENDALRDKYAASLASKNEEIRLLNRQILDLREEALRLGEENGRLKAELTGLRHEAEQAVRQATQTAVKAQAAIAAQNPPAQPIPVVSEDDADVLPSSTRRRRPEGKEIYLGRVNSRGLFVRADKAFTPGKSVYRLTTTDGFTGSYRVVEDSEMADILLDNPRGYLAGGCVAKDIDDTDEMSEIITESAGTAIFEEGAWRVLRKARIAYK